jgi:hypothetical protein
MTFEEAAEIVQPHPVIVDYPSKKRAPLGRQELIMVQLSDGHRRSKSAFIYGNLGVLKYQSLWQVIHIPSENAIYQCERFAEAEDFAQGLIRKRIDTNWGYRDLHVFKSILQLIGFRKEFRQERHPSVAETTTCEVSALSQTSQQVIEELKA